MTISLAEALKDGNLAAFIAQEEARGIGPIDRVELDGLTTALIKAPQLEDQTSRSQSDDGSTEKQTRQGSGRHIQR
jgi:hypothetical protein